MIKIFWISLAVFLAVLHMASAYFSFFFFEKIFFAEILDLEISTSILAWIICPFLLIIEIIKHFTTYEANHGCLRSIFFGSLLYFGSFYFAITGSTLKVDKTSALDYDKTKMEQEKRLNKLNEEENQKVTILENRIAMMDTLKQKRFKNGWALLPSETELLQSDQKEIEKVKEDFKARKKELVVQFKEKEKILSIQGKENKNFILPVSISIELMILFGSLYLFSVPIFNPIPIDTRETTKYGFGSFYHEIEEFIKFQESKEHWESIRERVSEGRIAQITEEEKNKKLEKKYKFADEYQKVRELIQDNVSLRSISIITGHSKTTILAIKKAVSLNKNKPDVNSNTEQKNSPDGDQG